MKKAVLFVMLCGALALSGSNLYAACSPQDIRPIGHFLGGHMDCDDTNGRVQGFIYQLSTPSTINSGPLNVACASAAGPSVSCTGSSPGDIGDHQVTFETDATIPGWVGCPTANRIIGVVVDSVGNGAMLSISGKDINFGYFMEAAHQTTDGNDIIPIACTPTGRPRVNSVSNAGGTINISLSVPPATIHTDCDAGSIGAFYTAAGGTICDGFTASPARGKLYTSTQLCGTADMTFTRWAASAITPDATGAASLSAPTPATGQCLFIASSSTVTGSPEILTGYVSVGGNLDAPPKAENLNAASSNGKVTIRWSTSTEVGLAAFKVFAQSKGKGSFEVATVSPKGNGGGSSYSVTLGMGDFKGGRSAVVRAVQTDGTFIDSAAVNF